MEETYILSQLWKGADFRLASDPECNRYCYLGYDMQGNECIAAHVRYDEPTVKINRIISFPFDTEVIFMPRGVSNGN